MRAIVELRETRESPAIYLNVAGNNPGRIYSIVHQYKQSKGFEFSHIFFDRSQAGLARLTNYKGTSYVK